MSYPSDPSSSPWQSPDQNQQPSGYGQQETSGYQQNPYDTSQYGQQSYPAYGQQPVPQNPYNPYQGGYLALQEHPQGTTIMILGILGFVTSGITGLIAWIMGRKALKEIDANPTHYSNRSQTHIGYILGIVTTCIFGGILVLYLLFIVVYVVIIVGVLRSGSY